jgi:hypothetical protein
VKQEIVVSVNDEGKVEGGRKSIAKAFLTARRQKG